jgi:hypothetical protein
MAALGAGGSFLRAVGRRVRSGVARGPARRAVGCGVRSGAACGRVWRAVRRGVRSGAACGRARRAVRRGVRFPPIMNYGFLFDCEVSALMAQRERRVDVPASDGWTECVRRDPGSGERTGFAPNRPMCTLPRAPVFAGTTVSSGPRPVGPWSATCCWQDHGVTAPQRFRRVRMITALNASCCG